MNLKMNRHLYGVSISYVDSSLTDATKTEERIVEDTYRTIAQLTGEGHFNDFGSIMNDVLHEEYPEAETVKILHATVKNWPGYDSDILFTSRAHPMFVVETNRELSDAEQNIVVYATNELITDRLSDVLVADGKSIDIITDDGQIYFSQAWDPDEIKQYFEDNNDNDFADAVSAISETDAISR